jgi:GH25 family lysozyme M1 (1,4-beta-N-acetylmuramidase)
MAFFRGIDVSKWNGSIDFTKVKNSGYDFVIIRAGYGKVASQKDENFETNYKNAKSAGLNVGAYWYSYATTTNEAKVEAKLFIECLKGKSFEYPVYVDIEEQKTLKAGKTNVTNIINAFCLELENAGYC